MLVLELARSDYVERRENIIAVGNNCLHPPPPADSGKGL